MFFILFVWALINYRYNVRLGCSRMVKKFDALQKKYFATFREKKMNFPFVFVFWRLNMEKKRQRRKGNNVGCIDTFE